jgi:hypothetical protein
VDAVLTYLFTRKLKPVRQGVRVSLTSPRSFPSQPGFQCEESAQQRRCTRWYPAPQAARFMDTESAGLRLKAVVLDQSLSLVSAAAQILLWVLLVPLTGVLRALRWPAPKPELRWLLARCLLVAGLLGAALAAWAHFAAGESSSPMDVTLSWAGLAFGLTALLFAHLRRADSGLRTVVFQLCTLGAIVLGVSILVLFKEPLVGLIAAGALAGTGFMLLYAESESGDD